MKISSTFPEMITQTGSTCLCCKTRTKENGSKWRNWRVYTCVFLKTNRARQWQTFLLNKRRWDCCSTIWKKNGDFFLRFHSITRQVCELNQTGTAIANDHNAAVCTWTSWISSSCLWSSAAVYVSACHSFGCELFGQKCFLPDFEQEHDFFAGWNEHKNFEM